MTKLFRIFEHEHDDKLERILELIVSTTWLQKPCLYSWPLFSASGYRVLEFSWPPPWAPLQGGFTSARPWVFFPLLWGLFLPYLWVSLRLVWVCSAQSAGHPRPVDSIHKLFSSFILLSEFWLVVLLMLAVDCILL